MPDGGLRDPDPRPLSPGAAGWVGAGGAHEQVPFQDPEARRGQLGLRLRTSPAAGELLLFADVFQTLGSDGQSRWMGPQGLTSGSALPPRTPRGPPYSAAKLAARRCQPLIHLPPEPGAVRAQPRPRPSPAPPGGRRNPQSGQGPFLRPRPLPHPCSSERPAAGRGQQTSATPLPLALSWPGWCPLWAETVPAAT